MMAVHTKPPTLQSVHWADLNGLLLLSLQRLAWRANSCQECKGPGGEDLSGGYYEAGGSYLKFTFPTAYTITQLSWGVVEYRDGYEKVHELREALEAIKWGTDYLLACNSRPNKIVAMFGSSEVRLAKE